MAGARAKDHLRAMSQADERVDGRLRIASRPPLLVPIEELLPATSDETVEEQVRDLLRTYRRSLPAERRHLLEATATGTWRAGSAAWGAWARGPGSSS